MIASELPRGVDQDIHGDAHPPEESTYLGIALWPGQCGFLNDEEINVAMWTPFAACPGAKEYDLLRVDSFCNLGNDDP